MFEKRYELESNTPSSIESEVYIKNVKASLSVLLEKDLSEKEYQSFFEKNPEFLMTLAKSFGNAPIYNILFSQPQLYGAVRRVPDFLIITQTSIGLHPIFIEIERPGKLQFRQNNVPRQDFNQAMDQIAEWKTILQDPNCVQKFYEDYQIDSNLQFFRFSPIFILIYGRRAEYESNSFLRNKRAEMERENIKIVSFDRLLNITDFDNNSLTCKCKKSMFETISISPTFSYKPVYSKTLKHLEKDSFIKAIASNEMISPERKEFLNDRFDYWKSFSELENQGLINTNDHE